MVWNTISGFDGKVVANYVLGSNDLTYNNGPSKSQNKMGEALSKEQYEKILSILEKSGNKDGIEKIEDLKKNREENIKD